MTIQPYKPNQSIVSQYSAAVVVGLGASGFSAVRYLLARGLRVSVMDSREMPPKAEQLQQLYPQVSKQYAPFEANGLAGHSLVVASPGVPLSEPMLRAARQNGALIVGDIELFFQENRKPVIAITGSNGKSTVTSLVGSMCRAGGMNALVAGNIGVPALDALTDEQDYDIAVLELSSFQLETTSQVPAESAAILNLSADHLDRYDSMGDYTLAKARILRGAKRAVLPRHDEQMKQISNVNEVLTFDLDEPKSNSEFGIQRQSRNRWLMHGDDKLMKQSDVSMIGQHNLKNVLSAFALVDFLNLPKQALVDAVKSFKGLPHRMQTVAVANEITWVNDSKATNIGATSTALRNMEQDIIWLAGGQGKGADFSELRDAVTNNLKQLIVFGEDADEIAAALEGALPIHSVSDLHAAVALAGSLAKPGTLVLLSPACASFDMFDGFEHRGEVFTQEVNSWLRGGGHE